MHTLGKSSDRSPEIFSILANQVISRKFLHLVERYFILEMSTQPIILIDQLSQLRWRENDGYPYSVKSHLIIPFI